PGGGGLSNTFLKPGPADPAIRARFEIPEGVPVVINPRGMKPYIRNDNFFRSIPLVLERIPNAIFLAGMMEGNSVAEGWVSRLGIEKSMRLLPYVSHADMASIFQLADVLISPSDHDGTPNSLLEAMACGVFPVAGDIESVREWIDDGVNGILIDQGSPESVADGIVRAIQDPAFRASADEHNRRMIAERVDSSKVMAAAEEFYHKIVSYAAANKKAGRS
ncbi:glycosyltransferase family 4 protein, partial [Singulisphaera rosea]